MKEVKHVAMYLRISEEKKQENVETLTNHRTILTDYCNEHNYTWEEFGEVLSGGASELGKRPQLQRLLDSIEKFDAILCVELSRISRNGLISETVLQYCMDYDKPIITPHYTYDLANNNNDVLTYRFGALIASQEHSLIGKRSKSNKITMAKQGLHVSGGVPYGYRRNKQTKKLEIYEEEAQAVRVIFQLHSQGLGSMKIVDILNREGYLPQRADAWNLPSVKRIIKNPVYKGTVVFSDRKRVKEHGKYVYKVLDVIEVNEAHPAIIDPFDWEQANKERQTRAGKFKVKLRERPAQFQTILKDLVFCGKCGRKGTFRKENNGKISIKPCRFLLPNSPERCNNCGMLVEQIEELVITDLKKYRAELHDELEKLTKLDTSNIESDIEKRLKHNNLQIKAIKQQQANLIDLAVQGIFSMEELKDKKQELESTLKELEETNVSLETQLEKMDVASLTQQLEKMVAKLDNFETLSIQQQNGILKQLIKKIHYTRVIPEDLKKLSTRNPERRNYPFQINIEYFEE